MGRRRRNAATIKATAQTVPEGGDEFPLQAINRSSEGAELQHGNTKESLGKVELQPKKQVNSGGISSRRKGRPSLSVRRSLRLQDTVVHTHRQDIQRVIEEIAISESEKEDEPASYEKTEQPDPTMKDKIDDPTMEEKNFEDKIDYNFEDKIDYLIRLLEEQRIRFSTSATPSLSNARYKSLYFDSQKKIETLTDENHKLAMKLENALGKLETSTDENRQLTMKLENALGKLEAYETGSRAYSDIMEKLKDVILISNITRANGNAVNISSETIHDAYTSKDAGHESLKALAKKRKVVQKK